MLPVESQCLPRQMPRRQAVTASSHKLGREKTTSFRQPPPRQSIYEVVVVITEQTSRLYVTSQTEGMHNNVNVFSSSRGIYELRKSQSFFRKSSVSAFPTNFQSINIIRFPRQGQWGRINKNSSQNESWARTLIFIGILTITHIISAKNPVYF